MGDIVNQFAAAHPVYFGALWAVGGFFARSVIFTKNNARKLIKFWFDRQRAALKRAGRSNEEIKSIMEDEAELLLSAAAEAKAEADTEGAPTPL